MINFSIVGCGNIAQRHAKLCADAGILAAVCDVVHDKALALAEKYRVASYNSIDDLLENQKNTDVVVICTPNSLHPVHAIKASRAGFHVLCEKPMAIYASDCRAMIQEAKKAAKELFVIKQNRFNPPVAAVKRLLDEKKLGKVYSVQLNCYWNRNANYYRSSWKGTREMDGGILYTQFSHFIDLLYWMVGDVKKVMAFSANFSHQGIIEFEDSLVASLEFENGAIGSIHTTINSYKKNMEGSISLFTEKGTVKIGGQYLNELTYQQIEDYRIENLPAGKPSNNYGDYEGSMSNHDQVYQHVTDVLTKGAVNQLSGHDGLKTVEIIEKIYKAVHEAI